MNPSDRAESPGLPQEHYLNHDTSIRSWLLTRDHKRIGVMFLALVLIYLFLGGLMALLIRLEHLTPGPTLVDALTYNRLFTWHGVIMVWLFMIPAIPSALGNFLLPLMIGARDVAFPRLNLASLYIFAVGSLVVMVAMIWGGADTGWTFYTPYATASPTAVFGVLLGVFIVGFSSILTALNFIVSVHTLRAPGLGWMDLPLFVWTLYGTAIIQALATPVLAMVLLLLAVERFIGTPIFDATRGGDPVLYQHLFWFYSHPAVYIMVLPAFGVISEVVAAFARKELFGYRMLVVSTFGISAVGFFVWGHHMFVAGQSTFGSGAFGVLSMLVAIFTAIKVFTWVGTLYRGAISLRTPLVYMLGFLFLLVFGGMTGVAVATTSLDIHWHDTYFVVAHFHFIMVGAVLLAFLAGLHYWWPKMFGRMYPERPALICAVVIDFGFFATFFPQFLLGNQGMPRRYYHYPADMQWLHVASTTGASLLGWALAAVALYLGWSIRRGAVGGANPWGSRGFEWYTESPPPPHNYPSPPAFPLGAYDYSVPVRSTRR